jgi:hypothetical protein
MEVHNFWCSFMEHPSGFHFPGEVAGFLLLAVFLYIDSFERQLEENISTVSWFYFLIVTRKPNYSGSVCLLSKFLTACFARLYIYLCMYTAQTLKTSRKCVNFLSESKFLMFQGCPNIWAHHSFSVPHYNIFCCPYFCEGKAPITSSRLSQWIILLSDSALAFFNNVDVGQTCWWFGVTFCIETYFFLYSVTLQMSLSTAPIADHSGCVV